MPSSWVNFCLDFKKVQNPNYDRLITSKKDRKIEVKLAEKSYRENKRVS